MDPKSLLGWLLSGANVAAFSAAFAIAAVQYVYGAFLARGTPGEQRARGYALMYDSVEGVVIGMMFFLGVFSLTPLILAGYEFQSPSAAAETLRAAVDRFIKWLMNVAELERDLSLFPLFAPLATTVASSSVLGRVTIQLLVGLSSGMAVAAEIMNSIAPWMFGTGLALACTSRTRRLGVYLAITAISVCIVLGIAAPYVKSTAEQLKFEYRSGNIIDFIYKGLLQQALQQLIEDGKLSATCTITLSIGLAVAAIAAAAASAAAGGFADSIISRIRL
ncbi:MAG: hypothetical protein QXU69_05325 [Thermofilaceae archaeon]